MFCQNCNLEHTGTYGSGRFCSVKCARGFSTKAKRTEINKQVSATQAGRKLTKEHIKNIELGNNFNRKEKIVKSCTECGAEMICRPSDMRKYCSTKCWVNYTEKNKEPYLLYRQRCKFTFSIADYPDKFNSDLILEHGWYSPSNKQNNLDGVSRDHMLSVKDGFINGIDPAVISHPANCDLVLHRANQRKRSNSSITVEELLDRIKKW
jgi:hypothetical protein